MALPYVFSTKPSLATAQGQSLLCSPSPQPRLASHLSKRLLKSRVLVSLAAKVPQAITKYSGKPTDFSLLNSCLRGHTNVQEAGPAQVTIDDPGTRASTARVAFGRSLRQRLLWRWKLNRGDLPLTMPHCLKTIHKRRFRFEHFSKTTRAMSLSRHDTSFPTHARHAFATPTMIQLPFPLPPKDAIHSPKTILFPEHITRFTSPSPSSSSQETDSASPPHPSPDPTSPGS